MDSFNKLIEQFKKFPGIGERQAKRFVYYILNGTEAYARELSKNILSLKKEMRVCPDCSRNHSGKNAKCATCETERDKGMLLVVASDVDLDTIEKSGSYKGYYFVLGGLVPILDNKPADRIRLRALENIIAKRAPGGLKEIVLALNANPEGENTGDFLRKSLEPTISKMGIKLTALGRGFSSGTEVEYSDPDTIKNALRGRL